jgi:tRNA G18 (ribose-2'-O)-methylase SpoU
MYTAEEAKALREQDPFDTRNIRDEFKGMPHDAILEALQHNKTPLVMLAENLIGDFNVSQIVRAANAFNARAVYICGKRQWNRRGAVGSHNYIDVEHWEYIQEAIQQLRDQGYRIVAAEYTSESYELTNYHWEEKSALLLGEEGRGLSKMALEMADDVVHIPMLGTVRSFNVAGAAQMFMYEYMNCNGFI